MGKLIVNFHDFFFDLQTARIPIQFFLDCILHKELGKKRLILVLQYLKNRVPISDCTFHLGQLYLKAPNTQLNCPASDESILHP